MNQKKLLPLLFIGGAVIGTGISMIPWGKADGVHGTGWPIPTKILGLPEDAEDGFEMMSDLGFFGAALNIALVILAIFLLWAVIKIFLRATGR